ncbi:hypothetical protein [Pelagibius sp.]|uniref:hypothetical protein n=1 Tax=Pelagibius sp. TaxID=1931238 RepID=UPI00262CDEA6|nr:hypothetical protein [Pelagibius sp.]
MVASVENTFWIRTDITAVQQKLFRKIVEKLENAPDYESEVKAEFDRLVLLLVKFLTERIDGESKRFPYLKRISNSSKAPKESALQDDLHNYLLSILASEVEKVDISSGRADIYIPRTSFRLIIELKRVFKWNDETLKPFLTQTVAYSQADIRLGVLGVLDLSDRPPGVPHIDKCFEVTSRQIEGEEDRTTLVMRVPGNVRTPSDSK